MKVIEDEMTEKSGLLQAELERLAVEEAEQQLEELLEQQAAHLGAFTALSDGSFERLQQVTEKSLKMWPGQRRLNRCLV